MPRSDNQLIINAFLIIFCIFFISFYSSSFYYSIMGISRIIASFLIASLFCSWLMVVAFLVKQPIIFLEMIKCKNVNFTSQGKPQFGSFIILTNIYLNEAGQKLRKQLIASFIYFVASILLGIMMSYLVKWYIQ
jgi:hypothetical protein